MVWSVFQIVYQSKSAVGRFHINRALRACSSRLYIKYSCLNIRPFTRIFRQVVHLALICAKTEKTKIGPERKIIKDFHSTLVCNNFLQRNEVRNDVKPGSSFLLILKLGFIIICKHCQRHNGLSALTKVDALCHTTG